MKKIFYCALAFVLGSASFGGEPEFLNQYEEAVSLKGKKVLLIIGADWCGGCVRLKKDLKSLGLEGYAVCVVDADERPDVCKRHSVSAYPTSLILSEGEEVSRKNGYEKRSYERWLKRGGSMFRSVAESAGEVAK